MALEIPNARVEDVVEHRFDDFVTEGGVLSRVIGKVRFEDLDHDRRDATLLALWTALSVEYPGGRPQAEVYPTLLEADFIWQLDPT